ncbi:MAG: filamentous hemagglutinin N-terminal domain-containing protein [Pseudomonadota bacterium]|nr:filamentous hemagglutinin N-terminal domain-containing protein [Pseudomonadota bacterium]
MTSRTSPATFTQLSAAVAALFAVNPAQALDPNALPSGGQVVAGQASISQVDARMDIRQISERAILNWQGFDIGAQAQVNFQQPSVASVALNRVVGVHPSEIQGRLTANGQVFLINPNGILFGPGAQVDVGGLVASTLKLSDADFLAGNARFTDGNMAGTLVNQGRISAAEGGYVALIAPRIRNDGDISAAKGSVFAGAGDSVTLRFADNRLLEMEVSAAQVGTLIENHQALRAPSGHILLRAEAAADLASSAINNGGLIDASAVSGDGGRIELLAGMSNGRINLSGTLKAQGGALPPSPAGGRGAGGEGDSTAHGGQIETSAAQVKIADTARVDTRAPQGRAGTWLIDPTDYTVAASGGDISGATLAANLQLGNVTLQTSPVGAGNGDLFVNDAVTWSADTVLTLTAHRDIQINRNLTATGNAAGLVLGYGAGRDYTLNGARVTLSGGNPLLKIGVAGAEETYTVINSLGVAGDTSTTTLQGMKNNPSGKYAFGMDIDANVTNGWNGGVGFETLGYFSGILAGLGHTVSNLTMRIYFDLNGDWGFITKNSGTVRDFGLMDGVIDASVPRYVLGVGGLVAWNDGTIANSYMTGQLIGAQFDTDGIGGLVGANFGVIRNSYAAADLQLPMTDWDSRYAGGLVGYNQGTIVNTYTTGSVSPGNGYLVYSSGGLVGDNHGVINNSYWDTQVSGQFTSDGGTGLTTAQMQQQASFPGWDFANTWRIYEGQSYPVLRALQTDLAITAGNVTKPHDGQPWSGGSASYSVPGASPAGALAYGGDAQGAVAPGSYAITPSGLVSDQRYHLSYAGGTLTILPPPPAASNPTSPDASLRDALAGLQPRNPGNLPNPPGLDGLIGMTGEGIRLPEGI